MATVILAATALKLSQPVLLPVTLGVFLVIVVWPLEAWLERQLWRWVAVFVTTLLVLLSLSALTYALVRSVEQLAVRGPCSR